MKTQDITAVISENMRECLAINDMEGYMMSAHELGVVLDRYFESDTSPYVVRLPKPERRRELR